MNVASEVPLTPGIDELTSALVGRALPGGEVTIHAQEAWLGHEAMGVQSPEGDLLDPMFAVVIALRGMSAGIAGVIELAQAAPAETLYGGLGVQQRTPLRCDRAYRVTGAITGVARRSGRRAGVFDDVEFELSVRDAQRGDVHAVVTNSFLFRRPSA